MQNSNYIQANVLLFDQTSSVLRQTMSVLQALGFKLIADAQKLNLVSGWKSNTTFQSGLSQTIDWWREEIAANRHRPSSGYQL